MAVLKGRISIANWIIQLSLVFLRLFAPFSEYILLTSSPGILEIFGSPSAQNLIPLELFVCSAHSSNSPSNRLKKHITPNPPLRLKTIYGLKKECFEND